MVLTLRAEPFMRSRQLCSSSRASQHFVEPEGSLPSSQHFSTGPYPEPDKSNPYYPILSLRHISMLCIHLRVGLPSGLFPSGFLISIRYEFLFSPTRATCPVHLIQLNYIINIKLNITQCLCRVRTCAMHYF
jgi:hypothetical protein